MASATELFDSRVGDVSADRNGFGASRLFKVIIDTVGDNPDDVLRDPTQVGNDAVPFGEPHEKRTGLQSAFYAVERRIASLKYIVRIIYAPPIMFTTQANPWEYSWSPGLGTTMTAFDRNGDPIGPSQYSKLETGGFRISVPQKEGDNKITNLRRDTTEPAFLQELQRAIPAGGFTLSRTFVGLNVDRISAISLASTTVNRTSFWGYPAGKIQFVGPAAQAGLGTDPATGTQGFIWRVALLFEYNALGFKPQFQETFRTEGLQLPVFDSSGAPVIREVPLYMEGDLNILPSLLDQMSASSLHPRLGISPGEVPAPTPIGGGR